MRVYIGADHAGVKLKKHIQKFLDDNGHVAVDCGAIAYAKADDYPDTAHAVAQKVSEDEGTMGILICDSGVGMSIVANRYRDIRAALVHTAKQAGRARQHNDANILCLGADFTKQKDAEEIITTFLSTTFSTEPRHARRIKKINR